MNIVNWHPVMVVVMVVVTVLNTFLSGSSERFRPVLWIVKAFRHHYFGWCAYFTIIFV